MDPVEQTIVYKLSSGPTIFLYLMELTMSNAHILYKCQPDKKDHLSLFFPTEHHQQNVQDG